MGLVTMPPDAVAYIKELEERVSNLERGALLWTPLAFGANWENFGAGTYSTAAYAIDAAGFVHVRGLVKSKGVVKVGYEPSALIGTLPVGYHPLATELQGGYGADGKNGTMRFDVATTGEIYLIHGVQELAEVTVGFVSLSQVGFATK